MTGRRLPLGMLLLLASMPAGAVEETPPAAAPPFQGTIFINRDIVTAEDPSSFIAIAFAGTGTRNVFDRRVERFVEMQAWLFIATYQDAKPVEIQVDPEFTREVAESHAGRYARVVGRLPRCLRAEVDTVTIHDGDKPFGGGNRNLLIHVLQARDYEKSGILEEALCHEAAHTSLDGRHAEAKGWMDAQKQDPRFISTYAQANPIREDVAESFLPYFAYRYRRDRIPERLAATIATAMPARITYFDAQHLDVGPGVRPGSKTSPSGPPVRDAR